MFMFDHVLRAFGRYLGERVKWSFGQLDICRKIRYFIILDYIYIRDKNRKRDFYEIREIREREERKREKEEKVGNHPYQSQNFD